MLESVQSLICTYQTTCEQVKRLS